MRYQSPDPYHPTLIPLMISAEDALARLDERTNRHVVEEGYRERGHFFDAVAALWVAGELVHVEDLVLHDAHMDARTPTHELTIAHSVLKARRRIWLAEPGWALSAQGLAALRGEQSATADPAYVTPAAPSEERQTVDGSDLEPEPALEEGDGNPMAAEFAAIDAAIARSQRLLDAHDQDTLEIAERAALAAAREPVGQLGLLFDEDWDEDARLDDWRQMLAAADQLPPCLGAALLFDAWDRKEPLRRQHWLGALLVGAYLRSRGKVTTHLLSFNTGLKTIRHERRRSQDASTRWSAFLEAMTVTADLGLKELDRLSLAKTQMDMRIRDRRSNSSLPGLIELVLSRPIVSAALVAKHVGVTPRGALNLVRELGIREMTGRGRYRGWGVL
ncbi:RHE_PE00001 family protein [Ensifer adhaerens]|uniref:RHE_PE00001 family protein n=1 Tax=Ensifer adhaerens TaxID=106592 RepID=UPI000990033F|nr:RHE_PE00001 family protein [Ensifer adhaerens]